MGEFINTAHYKTRSMANMAKMYNFDGLNQREIYINDSSLKEKHKHTKKKCRLTCLTDRLKSVGMNDSSLKEKH
jgi:hypothetical protein